MKLRHHGALIYKVELLWFSWYTIMKDQKGQGQESIRKAYCTRYKNPPPDCASQEYRQTKTEMAVSSRAVKDVVNSKLTSGLFHGLQGFLESGAA